MAEENPKKNASQILMEELMATPSGKGPWWRRVGQVALIPVLAVISGLIVGALIIALTSEEVYAAWAQSPIQAVIVAFKVVGSAYGALFAGSIGRTDFPGGSFETIKKSIRQKLFALDDDLTVYPGHGPTTTIAEERRTNPFVGDNAYFRG